MTERQCCQILGMPKRGHEEPPAGIPICLVIQWDGPEQQLTIEMVFGASRRVAGGLLFKRTSDNGQTAIASLDPGLVADGPETLFARLRRWLRL
jgi:hypothetical protein